MLTTTALWSLSTKGSMAGELPSTGKQFTIQETAMDRIEDGKLAECWVQVDWLGLLQQLGALTL